MCGLVAVFDRDEYDSADLNRMCNTIAHRGPDHKGIVILNNNEFQNINPEEKNSIKFRYGFGFNRLSIQDLSNKASQPMISDDERYLILFNGEVYNFLELRSSLIEKGYKLKSKSDTEVILKLFQVYGENMLEMINGMFAIVIFDKNKSSFFVCRDRLGIKPLYYYYDNQRFIVASEMKSILIHNKISTQINSTKLNEYLAFRYISGNETLFRNIYEVEPAQKILFHNNIVRKEIYWNINSSSRTTNGQDKLLDSIINSSVDYQLISDVEVGTQLSGGLDSSLIASTSFLKEISRMKSFSIIPEDKEHSEEKYIDYILNKYGFDAHKIKFNTDHFHTYIEKATWHFDQPLSQPNSIGIYVLSKFASNYLKVLLSGEGADEIFGGYDRYCVARMFEKHPYLSSYYNSIRSNKYKRDGSNLEELLIFLSATSKISEIKEINPSCNKSNSMGDRKKIFNASKIDSFFKNYLKYETKTYLNELLIRQDKMCMANGIENRVPYLDHRLVEFAFSLKDDFKTSTPYFPVFYNASLHTKKILKKYGLKSFNKEFIYRKKMGFSTPLEKFFNQKDKKDYFFSIIENLNRLGILENKLPLNYLTKINDMTSLNTKWTIYALSVWSSVFKII